MISLATCAVLTACSSSGTTATSAGDPASGAGSVAGGGTSPAGGSAAASGSAASGATTSGGGTAGGGAAASSSGGTAAGGAGGSGALPGCMVGSWSAPITRESQQLNLTARTKGAVTRVSGTARMVYTAKAFTFTYDKVSFDIRNAGAAKVTGSLAGTYSVSGRTLKSKITKSKVKVSITVGGTTIPADQAFNGIATGLAPTDVTVACTANQLAFTQRDGTVVTFDKA